MSLLDRVRSQRRPSTEERFTVDTWLSQYLFPAQFQYGNTTYTFGNGLTTTMAPKNVKAIANSLPSYLGALQTCPPAFAAQMVRAMVLSQVRFTFRRAPWDPVSPRKTFGGPSLILLEQPWPNGTTGDLVGLMEWHAGLAGNAFCVRRPDRLRVLRPDWVGVLYGSELEPDADGQHALDGELLGYVYQNGGFGSMTTKPEFLDVADVAHWSPIPDPENPGLGMSWITPGLRDIQGDQAANEYKTSYLRNGATPNLVVKGIPAANVKQFNEIVDAIEEKHKGAANAFRTLYLTGGSDASIVGSNLKDLDLRNVQGGGETRLAMLSRVPAPVLGIAASLEGSSLNAGNFGQARRLFSDTWVFPTLQDLSHTLQSIVDMPPDRGAELWFDTLDMPLLREDARDAAEIASQKATTIWTLVQAGYTPDSASAAVEAGDFRLLKHTGLVSVQLHPSDGSAPKTAPPAAPAADQGGADATQAGT